MSDDTDDRTTTYFVLFDQDGVRRLDDVGLPGHALVEAIDPEGVNVLMLSDLTALGDHPDNVVGDRWPPHELQGRMSQSWRSRIAAAPVRCSRPTRNGRPCRAIVAEPGDACVHHRQVIR